MPITYSSLIIDKVKSAYPVLQDNCKKLSQFYMIQSNNLSMVSRNSLPPLWNFPFNYKQLYNCLSIILPLFHDPHADAALKDLRDLSQNEKPNQVLDEYSIKILNHIKQITIISSKNNLQNQYLNNIKTTLQNLFSAFRDASTQKGPTTGPINLTKKNIENICSSVRRIYLYLESKLNELDDSDKEIAQAIITQTAPRLENNPTNLDLIDTFFELCLILTDANNTQKSTILSKIREFKTKQNKPIYYKKIIKPLEDAIEIIPKINFKLTKNPTTTSKESLLGLKIILQSITKVENFEN